MRYLDDFRFETRQTGEVEIAYRRAGDGPPLLLLHGYPQTNVMWHKIAPALAKQFTVIAPDLRGYGDSGKPPTDPTHQPYSKRVMARDMVALMAELGFDSFNIAGHDRGGRVAHRLARDCPEKVHKIAVLDIAPTLAMYDQTNMQFATAYYHWFFLIQAYPMPESLIGSNVEAYMESKCGQWGRTDGAFTKEAWADYMRCFRNPETIHASCEDYRAAATIDLDHDRADADTKLSMPLMALWGQDSFVGTAYDVLSEWRKVAANVSGHAVPGGHYCAEESPNETHAALLRFFLG